MGKHVMECLGMSRVVIEDEKIIDISEPEIKYCPLFKKYRNIDELSVESIRNNIEYRMKTFGMCCENRETRMKDFLSFGISEILSSAVRNKYLDAAVIAADGCGTVILTDPELIQGLGGRISGLCETSPIKKVIDDVGSENVLDPINTPLDSIAGVGKAKAKGHKMIGVTVASAKDAQELRKTYGNNLVIIAVHTSKKTEEETKILFDNCDIITACASYACRMESKKRDVIIAGNKVPVYGVTEKGKELVNMRLEEVGKEAWNGNPPEEPPYPLI